MSSIFVEIVKVGKITQHPNGDRLCLAAVKGWQTCIRKLESGSPEFEEGQLAIYVPADSVIPQATAEKLGVLAYLSNKTDIEGKKVWVVRRINLRGQPSYGFFVPCSVLPIGAYVEGQDVKDILGITKYMPPVKSQCGDAESDCQMFQKYTHIEHWQNFPDILNDGEIVFITEKIHGTNCRVGIVNGEEMAGSHEVRRKRPTDENMRTNRYWFPWTLPNVRACLTDLAKDCTQVVLYGEVYGPGIQVLTYGKTSLGFAAFDILRNGRYLDYKDFLDICDQYQIETVPLLETAVYSRELVKRLSSGKTTLGANHIREGCVIRPEMERTHPAIGRVVLKLIGDEYATNKGFEKEDSSDV